MMFSAIRTFSKPQDTGPGYRYWQLFILENNGHVSTLMVAEVELRTAVGGADVTTPSTPTTATTSQASTPPSRLVDDNQTSTWASLPYNATNQALTFDLGVRRDIKQVQITAESNTAPRSFYVRASNDGVNFVDMKYFGFNTDWTVKTKTFNL